MNKKEILKISRENLKDEGIEYCESNGIKYGYIVFVSLYLFLAVIDLIYGESSTFYALTALFLVFIASKGFVRWKMFKSKIFVVQMICGIIASIMFIVKYLIIVLR